MYVHQIMCLVIISRAQNSPGIGLQNFFKQSDILVKDRLREIREITATTEFPFEQIEFVQLISNLIVNYASFLSPSPVGLYKRRS